jgi:lipopolysaccharide export system protein LptC
MSDRFASWFPLVLLAVLAVLTFWLDQLVQPLSGNQTTVRHDPDYIVDGLNALRMDATGRVKHTLVAKRMTHFPDDDLTLLVDPKLVAFSEEHPPVTVTSRHGRVSGNGDHVYFQDDVRVVRAPDAKQTELVLETNYLHVIPDDNIAQTDQPVKIFDGQAVVTASGLDFNSETRVLNLQGRVRGVFENTQGPVRHAP